jgi:hypothetical protein
LAEFTSQEYAGLDAAYKAYIRTNAPADESAAGTAVEQAAN